MIVFQKADPFPGCFQCQLLVFFAVRNSSQKGSISIRMIEQTQHKFNFQYIMDRSVQIFARKHLLVESFQHRFIKACMIKIVELHVQTSLKGLSQSIARIGSNFMIFQCHLDSAQIGKHKTFKSPFFAKYLGQQPFIINTWNPVQFGICCHNTHRSSVAHSFFKYV